MGTKDKTAALKAELGLDATTGVDKAEKGTDVSVTTLIETKAKDKAKDDTSPFRRMKPTAESTVMGQKKRPVIKTKKVTKRKTREITSNASLIIFPSDRFGVTKDIKRAIIHAASRTAGNQEKKDLVLEVIDMLVKHVHLKFDADRNYRELLAKRKADNAEDK